MKKQNLSELEKMTDNIVRGEEIVLFAPGLWSAITTIILLIIATVILAGSTIAIWTTGVDTAALQLLGFLLIFGFVILLGILLFRGSRRAWIFHLIWSIAIALMSIIAIIANQSNSHLEPLLLCIGCSLIFVFLIKSSAYQFCSEFYYLIKTKKRNNTTAVPLRRKKLA